VSASVGSFQTQEAASDEILVEVSKAHSSDVIVNYTITDNNTINGVDYVLAGSSVTIPAGEYSAAIPFDVLGNLVFEGVARSFTVTLSSVSVEGIRIDGIQEITVTLIDDDCEFHVDQWVGTYTVVEAFTSGVNAPNGFVDFFGESYQVEFAADPNDPAGLTAIWTNSDGFDPYFVDGITMVFEVCDGTVSFPGGDPELAAFTVLTISSSSFNAEANEIRVDGEAGPYGPYGFTLTKQ
jgi:hypothetical protein